MKILSVNIGQPQQIRWKKKTIVTSIFKNPISNKVRIIASGVEGDVQSDLMVHGGKYKAVYVYPYEHYDFWSSQFPNLKFNWGMFGENLTTSGLLEDQIHLGDIIGIGTVELKVTQPRFPCLKLGLKFDDSLMIKKFLESRKSGFYCSVFKEGQVFVGDRISILNSEQSGTTIREFVDVYTQKNPKQEKIEAILEDPNLMEDWIDFFKNKLVKVS
ncbi:MAG: MOSC domain-containing protein [Bacteroidetes bacterium]|nr:MOSC domain-containing protein [Bacteroidota bacterium]MDA1121060.1 MOSC domain-containing protein [Bacteroidota bacterium]